jgi:hypothetical protein
MTWYVEGGKFNRRWTQIYADEDRYVADIEVKKTRRGGTLR